MTLTCKKVISKFVFFSALLISSDPVVISAGSLFYAGIIVLCITLYRIWACGGIITAGLARDQ